MFCSITTILLVSLTQCAAFPTLSESLPAGAAPLSRYLNSFSLEFKDFPSFAGLLPSPVPSSTYFINVSNARYQEMSLGQINFR
jgi:hypothetical protein